MEVQKKTYFEYLDALRCLAFLAVFYAHTGTIFLGANISSAFPLNFWKKFTVYGSYGVNFFFVLSGFLITYLLLREKKESGNISINKFYLKRILRIWPVYFITLLFSFFLLPFLISNQSASVLGMTNPVMSWQTFWYFFFFVGNFYQGLGIGMGSLSIGILWSVCVEEQFYLVWPWVVKWFNERKLILITVLLIALSLLYKLIWAEDRVANYYLPWSVGMDLAFGALLGILYFKGKIRQIIHTAFYTFVGFLILMVGVVGLSYFQTKGLEPALSHSIIKASLIDILRLVKTPLIDCVFVLLLLFFLNRTSKILSYQKHPLVSFLHLTKSKIKSGLSYLGKISYGLYAYHTICLMLTVSFLYTIGFLKLEVTRGMFLVAVSTALILTICVAHLSSIFIERRFLGLRKRFKIDTI